ncbi:MAG TPA: hypothetical protein VIM11_17655 [Tepidisphaeraceae bacterium]|jgi:hypothetical protein
MVEMSMVLARVRREPLANFPLGPDLDQALRDRGYQWRERLLTPMLTLKLFLTQVLAGNCSIAALRQLAGVDFAPSSYSDARKRLPLDVLQWLLQWLQARAERSLGIVKKIGPRILITDGSSYSMPDTPELRAHFHLPGGTKPGVGYPSGKLMGLLDAATGMFLSLLALPLFTHDMRGVIGLHPMLREGDILLACREPVEWETGPFAASATWRCSRPAACSPACVCISAARRKAPACTPWKRPTKPPVWMDLLGLALLPKSLDVRIVCYTIARKGYRTRRVLLHSIPASTGSLPATRIRATSRSSRWMLRRVI